MKQHSAMDFGREVLIWLASHDNLLPVFMNSTGGDIASIREGVDDPAFLGAVLDFLLMDDAWIEEFCRDTGHAPTEPAMARAGLPGGDHVHWT